MSEKFIAVDGQCFHCFQDWVNRARLQLTCHPEYHNTEHGGPAKGWRGHHFTTMCFDQKGRRCRIGSDFMRAEKEDAFPVWWIWPDQIVPVLKSAFERAETMQAEKRANG